MAGLWRWQTAQFAERKWWQNYLQKKDVQSYLTWKKNYWENVINQCKPALNISTTDTILDVGCGPAGVFMCFPQNLVTALDPLLDAYEVDLPHFTKAQYPHVKFVNEGIENHSIQSQFDIVFCMNAINHVQDIEKSYDNLLALTKPGGILVVSIDAHNYNFFKYIFKALPGDILHPHQYNLQEYESFLTNRGCIILQTLHLQHTFLFDHYLHVAQKQ